MVTFEHVCNKKRGFHSSLGLGPTCQHKEEPSQPTAQCFTLLANNILTENNIVNKCQCIHFCAHVRIRINSKK